MLECKQCRLFHKELGTFFKLKLGRQTINNNNEH